jgi:amino acid adenylation domain-containing protein
MFPNVGSLFSSVAAAQPERAAVVQAGSALSYGELEAKANRLAYELRSAGVVAGTLVGICIEQSIDFVVGVVGIIKCGAAYVPLDPASPPARLELMIRDSGISCVVTNSHHQGWLKFHGRTLLIDTLTFCSSATGLKKMEAQPDQLAYLMYTSGTTGTPKGVEITHRSLANLVQWCRRAFEIVPADRTPLFAPIGFDAAVRELWPHLTSGCTLFIPPEGLLRTPEELCQWIVENEITITYLPTPVASRLVRMSWPDCTKLRYVYTGGDALRDYPIPGLPFRFVNEYGPAESTVFASSYTVPALRNPKQSPPIGRPIDGVQIYILDENLAEVPPGVGGEICIGGEGLARGYHDKPELTDQSFVQGIQGASRGMRIYRTGDLGRYNVDGNIEFIGRNDEQVKIRGYRIECGEIETCINQLDGVRGSAVVKQAYGVSDDRLIAYIVPAQGVEMTREGLRSFLQSRLPVYMIPEEFIQMSELPITGNGKIDKRALPDPQHGVRIRNTEVSDSVVERHLIMMLQKLLGVEQVGRHDNIFLLGGNSFIAMQLIARIQADFDIRLTPQSVFAKPTAADLALEIEHVILTRIAVPI